MDAISNIIFDLGGVVYDICYENVANAFVQHGVTNLGEFYSRSFQTHEMDLLEEGLISVPEFHDYIRRATHMPLTDNEIDDIMNAILIDIPSHRVALLLALRQKYRVFLYSNTNEINHTFFTRAMQEKYGFDIFDRCFDKAYFSQIMHMRKPKAEGFHLILNENHLDPKHTVFIDDNMPNVEAAIRAGLHGLYLNPVNDVSTLFDDRFNLRTDRVDDCSK